MDWFRWHHGTVTDPKFGLIAKRAGVPLPAVIAVWAYLLEAASMAERRGDFGTIDTEALDCMFALDDGKTAAIIDSMRARGMIAETQLCAWERRQPKREREDSSADRVRAHRAAKKAAEAAAGNDTEGDVTPSNATNKTETPREEEIREEDKQQGQQHAPPAASGGDVPKRITSPKRDAPKTLHRFAEFWAVYPVKKGKAEAMRKWAAKGLDAIADQIIAHVRKMEAEDAQWKRGFIPYGSTYVNGEGWLDVPSKDPADMRTVTAPAPAAMGAKVALAPSETPLDRDLNWLQQRFERGEFGEGEAGRQNLLAERVKVIEKHRGHTDGND